MLVQIRNCPLPSCPVSSLGGFVELQPELVTRRFALLRTLVFFYSSAIQYDMTPLYYDPDSGDPQIGLD